MKSEGSHRSTQRRHYIFVDESGDPGRPYTLDASGNTVPTGASMFYIISAICVDERKLFLMQRTMTDIKARFGYTKEIKSTDISLSLYKELLAIITDLDISVYYRLIDKTQYRGKFQVDGIPQLHNVFDEYNVAKTVAFAVVESDLADVDVVIDRTDRRLFNGTFDAFNEYLVKKVEKYSGVDHVRTIRNITHVDSVYVYAMQISDIIGGAIRDNFTGKNKTLIQGISQKNLIEVNNKHEHRTSGRFG